MKCPCPCCRPLSRCPRRACTAASLRSRPLSSSMRRAFSPRVSTRSSMPSPARWPMGVSCRSAAAGCMLGSSRPSRRSWGTGWLSSPSAWPIMPCGEVWAKALTYCRQAGEKALARSAHSDAAGYFEQALSALTYLPEERDTREEALDLRLALRSALLPSGDAERILAALREAEALAVALDDHRRLGHISGFLSVQFRSMGAYDQSIASAQRALALAVAH